MENITEIYKALDKFRENCPEIKKTRHNTFFKSNYAALEDILPVIQKTMKEVGLTVFQVPLTGNSLKTTIIHLETGESIQGKMDMPLAKQDPQGAGSAITYMRRYALVTMLGLNIEEDDDGNAASKRTVHVETVPTKTTDSSTTKTAAKKPYEFSTPSGEPFTECADCKQNIDSQKVIDYSKEKFGKALCFNCQKK